MRDHRVDAGLNATLDTGSVMFKILRFSCLEKSLLSWMWRTSTTEPQPLLAFMPKAL
jgi:hypothetical protein